MTIFKKSSIAMIAALSLAVGGCATSRPVGQAPGVQVTDLTQLPVPKAAGTYRIGPQQTLEIHVVGVEEISGPYLSDAEGAIDFPWIGRVEAAGKTPAEVARDISVRLEGQYILDPQVRVQPQGGLTATISIGGEVSAPGTFPANTSYTLMRAINNAGGYDKYAKRDEVLIMRSVDGSDYVGVYNMKEIARGNMADPAVYPGDVIMVGDSVAARRLETALSLISILSASILVVDRVEGR